MDMDYILKDDYDKKHRLNKQDVFCYSKDQLDELYPNRDYYIIGVITGRNYDKEKGSINKFIYKGNAYALYDRKKKSKLAYANVGYICVGDDKFVEIVRNRIPFLIIFLILLSGIIIAGSVLIGNLSNNGSEPQVAMLNPLPEKDPYVEEITQNQPEELEPEKGLEEPTQNAIPSSNSGGKVSMVYTLEAKLKLSTGKITMMFQNPKGSNHSVSVELYVKSGDKQIKIAQSKLVDAGYGITTLDFISDSAVLKEGVYTGFYKVKYYNPKTGEKAIVESQIDDVEITVNN